MTRPHDDVWERLREVVTAHEVDLCQQPVTPRIGADELARRVDAAFDFDRPREPAALLREVAELLSDGILHTSHPRYFGLFNPPALPVTIFADALTAAFNPQLATWAHGGVAHAIERRVLDRLRRAIGLPEEAGGHFTSGGQEANSTAMSAALTAAFPGLAERGLRALDAQPLLYVSEQAHHSFHKTARQCGLGSDAVRSVPTDARHRLRPETLREAIVADRRGGHAPFLVVATAGTTGTGAIDPIAELADLCRELGLWLHVDAAWGGTALLSPRLAPALDGIQNADSVTWDAHKWMCVPVGAGMCFLREPGLLGELFQVRTGYVPEPSESAAEPYVGTMQWSRRFIGLKVAMAMAALGLDGYAAMIERMADTGDRLRALLSEAGWEIANDTPLPLVCAARPDLDRGSIESLATAVQRRGRAWTSSVALPDGSAAIRACITSPATDEEDLRVLVDELGIVASQLASQA